MIVKEVTYINFDGEEVTEKFYFNLTKAELTKMELSYEGGLMKAIDRIVESKNLKQIADVIEDLILRSYGEKSADGKRFIKNKDTYDSFAQTGAYSKIFMEMVTNADAAAAFINALAESVTQ
jgi:hypothetical protein